MNKKIGFIGQGWIGRNYANDFENRGYETVRYALEEPYAQNKTAISTCDIVFVAVPTPSTPEGFSYDAVKSALACIKDGATVVIKSTLLPGTTEKLQAAFPNLYVMHSPEFLREVTAAHDAANPSRNIIGIAKQTEEFQMRAQDVLSVLPTAPYTKVMDAYEAEFVKYAGNCFLYTKVVFMNALYDLISAHGADFEQVREAMAHDPRIGASHTEPIHKSGHDTESGTTSTRGAGGHCFIKDFEAFRQFFADTFGDTPAHQMLQHMIMYNNALLIESQKDIDILTGVYGEEVIAKTKATK